MKHLSKLVKSIIKEEQPTPPASWRSGFKKSKGDDFDSSLRLMSGEEPFQIRGKWYLYVWDEDENDITVYDFSSDFTIDYMDFQKQIGMIKENRQFRRRANINGLLKIIKEYI